MGVVFVNIKELGQSVFAVLKQNPFHLHAESKNRRRTRIVERIGWLCTLLRHLA